MCVFVCVTHDAYDKWNTPSVKLDKISYRRIVTCAILLNHTFFQNKFNLISIELHILFIFRKENFYQVFK